MLPCGQTRVPQAGDRIRPVEKALSELDREKDITVSTFRENDEKGAAPRALYRKFGFAAGELTVEFGYPNQLFTLPGSKHREQQA